MDTSFLQSKAKNIITQCLKPRQRFLCSAGDHLFDVFANVFGKCRDLGHSFPPCEYRSSCNLFHNGTCHSKQPESVFSYAIVTSIWLSTNWLLFPLEEEMPSCQHAWAHRHCTGVHPQVTPRRWHRLASLPFSEGNLNIFQYSL